MAVRLERLWQQRLTSTQVIQLARTYYRTGQLDPRDAVLLLLPSFSDRPYRRTQVNEYPETKADVIPYDLKEDYSKRDYRHYVQQVMIQDITCTTTFNPVLMQAVKTAIAQLEPEQRMMMLLLRFAEELDDLESWVYRDDMDGDLLGGDARASIPTREMITGDLLPAGYYTRGFERPRGHNTWDLIPGSRMEPSAAWQLILGRLNNYYTVLAYFLLRDAEVLKVDIFLQIRNFWDLWDDRYEPVEPIAKQYYDYLKFSLRAQEEGGEYYDYVDRKNPFYAPTTMALGLSPTLFKVGGQTRDGIHTLISQYAQAPSEEEIRRRLLALAV